MQNLCIIIFKVPIGSTPVAGGETTIEGSHERIGDFLVKRGVITPDHLRVALDAQKREPKKLLGELLFKHRFIDDTSVVEALRVHTAAPHIWGVR